MSRHTDLIDAVNDATTEYDRTYAMGVLEGWRSAYEELGRRVDYVGADLHSMARFGEDASMCAGVLLSREVQR